MLEIATAVDPIVLQVEGALNDPTAAAAIAVGLAAFGAGYAERGIGASAVGAMAEDEDLFVKGLIMTVLPETLVILALVAMFLVL